MAKQPCYSFLGPRREGFSLILIKSFTPFLKCRGIMEQLQIISVFFKSPFQWWIKKITKRVGFNEPVFISMGKEFGLPSGKV